MAIASDAFAKNLSRVACLALAMLLAVCALAGCTGGDAEEEEEEETTTSVSRRAATSAGSADEDDSDEDDAAEADDGTEDDAEADDAAESDSSETADDADEPTIEELAATTLNDDGIPISESMPYKGMDAQFIDVTWMGVHDRVGDVVESGKYKGGVSYYWNADNGTGDVVFSALVLDGEVAKVTKWNTGTDYWREPGMFLTLDYPNLNGTGELVESSSSTSTPEDPTDYSTPEEYADNNEDYWESLGSDDPWNDAYEYWEDNAA